MKPMTWGEFKKLVEEKGVTDETKLDYIDIDPYSDIVIDLSSGEAAIWS